MTSGTTYSTMPSQMQGPSISMMHAYNPFSPTTQLDAASVSFDQSTEDFAQLNLQDGSSKDFSAASPEANSSNLGLNMSSNMGGQMMYQLQDGTVIYPGAQQYLYQPYGNNLLPAPFSNGQLHDHGYGQLPQNGGLNGPSNFRGQSWTHGQTLPPVPDLINRRSSWSSNEDASPHTPAYGNWQTNMYANKISPSVWSNPSPMAAGTRQFLHYARYPNGKPYLADFWSWTHLDPVIPEPVPARHSGPDGGRGSLDKILDNPDGTTNVYVRGLQPDTTDELLGRYGQRFGEIDSQKAIVDHVTGKCKGFGFIKYHNFIAAENCIRAFYHLGYEAKFARESHNSRLKALSEIGNTNLYISNLPKTINEDGLKNIFATVFPPDSFPDYRAGSCKILKDSCGISRGVGFARFESPKICEVIIETFNNRVIGQGDEATTLQVRFADTPKQKELKAQTAIKRQFKADEYNEAVYGIPFPHVSPVSPAYSNPMHHASGSSVTWADPSPMSSISPSHMGYPNSVLRPSRHSSGMSSIMPIRVAPIAQTKMESPSVIAAAKRTAAQTAEDSSTVVGSSTSSDRAAPSSKNTSVSTYVAETIVSPSKSK